MMNKPLQPMRIPVVFSEEDNAATSLTPTMATARAAQQRWACVPIKHRLRLVRKLRQLIAENARKLAEASAKTRSRPISEALAAEVLPLAEACRFLELNAERILRPQRFGIRGRPIWLAAVQSEIRREPCGVILIIGPENYPLFLPGVQLLQALMAGNTVLLKPGVGGTGAALALRELILRAGFPPDILTLLPESTDAAREVIAAGPDKVLFTGSAVTGENILAQLAPQLIPATMELSGCDAAIVRADADIDLAVNALVFGLSLNNGATCLSPKRVFVHRSIATELEGRLSQSFGLSSASQHSSTHNPEARTLVDEAIALGAHFIIGGIGPDGSLTTPMVLAGASASSRLLNADIFLPIISIVTVADDDEAVLRANDCPFALGMSIYSRDESAARSLAARVNAGFVTINDLIVPTADARLPFGGRARSGFGVTRGAEGLLELTKPKVVTTTRGTFRPAFAKPHPGDETLFESYLHLVHGRGGIARWNALVSIIQSLLARRKSSAHIYENSRH